MCLPKMFVPFAGPLICSPFWGKPVIRKTVFVTLCLALALGTSYAQSNYANVSGSVLDPEHRPVPGARVHVTASDTGAQREVVSNATGIYEIAGLLPAHTP